MKPVLSDLTGAQGIYLHDYPEIRGKYAIVALPEIPTSYSLSIEQLEGVPEGVP